MQKHSIRNAVLKTSGRLPGRAHVLPLREIEPISAGRASHHFILDKRKSTRIGFCKIHVNYLI